MTGAQALREAIADKTAEIYGYRPDDVSDITVTAGATEALYAAITALVRAGDEVICFDRSQLRQLCPGRGALRRSVKTHSAYAAAFSRRLAGVFGVA